MCTLSFIARDSGYLLGMNRDERIARGAGVLPDAREFNGTVAIYPSDGADGTWIGVNDHAITLALLNWNDVVPGAADKRKTRSRGLLIPALIGSRFTSAGAGGVAVFSLEGMLPFRLVGIFPSEKEICEWRWDSEEMERLHHDWKDRHWFSSSLSDKQAESMRGTACRDARDQSDAGHASWLRRLHASHADTAGLFSLCVHRPDVRTLSYTEIECTPARVRMDHFIGSPCTSGAGDSIEIKRTDSVALREFTAGIISTP